jgi:hypothetical protein
MKKIFTLIGCLLLFFPGITQLTATFTPSEDNTIYQENDNSNGAGANIFVGTTNNDFVRRALMAFDISLPAGASVKAVTLTLVCNRTTSGVTNISLHKLTSSWGEGTSDALSNEGSGASPTNNDASWNYRFYTSSMWTTPGGDFVSTVSASTSVQATGTYTWSGAGMVADVQSWLANPTSNFGWILLGDESTLHTAKRFASKENTTTTTRPQLTISYTSALPVSIISFEGKQVHNGVELQWQTASEQDNSYFKLEHGTDGNNFTEITRMPGSPANSTVLRDYHYFDPQQQPGKHFYKLSQVDLNGKTTYAPITEVVLNSRQPAITIYPNPAVSEILIDHTGLQTGNKYLLINSAGIIIRSSSLGSGHVSISDLPKGAYIFKILNGASSYLAAFVKQ